MRRQGTPGQRFKAESNSGTPQRAAGQVPGSPQLPVKSPGGVLPSQSSAAKQFNNPGGGGARGVLPGPKPGGILPKPPATFGAGRPKSRAPGRSTPGIPMQRESGMSANPRRRERK